MSNIYDDDGDPRNQAIDAQIEAGRRDWAAKSQSWNDAGKAAKAKTDSSSDDSTENNNSSLKNAEEGGHQTSGLGSSTAKSLDSKSVAKTEKGGAAPAVDHGGAGGGGGDGKDGLFKDDDKHKKKKGGKLKWLIGGATGIGVLFMAGAIVLFMLSALEIPNFVENIFSWQFARTTRILMEQTANVTSEKIAVEASSDGVYKTYEQAFGKEALWQKMLGPLGFNPNKEIKNLGTGAPVLKYANPTKIDTALGRDNGKLVSILINGKEIAVKPILQDSPILQGLFGRVVPGFDLANNISFAKDFIPELQQSFRMNETGFIARSTIQRELRQRLGISLYAWVAAKYISKSASEAEAIAEQEAYAHISATANPEGIPDTTANEDDSTKQAQEAAEQAEKDAVANDPGAIAASNGQLPQKMLDAIQNALTADNLVNAGKAFAKFASGGVWTAMMGLCMIYSGSLQSGSAVIDANSAEDIRAFTDVAAADSQVKVDGNRPGSTEAIQAMSTKINGHGLDNNQNGVNYAQDLSTSDAELIANNQKVVIPPGLGPQSSALGQYSIYDSLLPGSVAGIADTLSGSCGSVTSIWTGLGLGLLNIGTLVAGLFTGGATDAVEGAAEGAGEVAVDETVSEVASATVSRLAKSFGFLSKSGKFGKQIGLDTIKFGAVVGGLTLVAKMIVIQNMGSLNNGLAMGKTFDDQAFLGGNLSANVNNREALYGRPLTNAELTDNDALDVNEIITENQHKSAFERYLALDNTSSLLNHIGSDITLKLNGNIFATLLTTIGSIFNPMAIVPSLLSPFTGSASAAAPVNFTVTSDAGIVQWGRSKEELNILANDPSYKPLENEKILDDSGQADKIEAKYGICWDNSQATMGTLLSKGDINRNKDGGVNATDGLCSPYNLSDQNNEFGHAMIFRWEVNQGYSNAQNTGTLDEHIGISSPEGN